MGLLLILVCSLFTSPTALHIIGIYSYLLNECWTERIQCLGCRSFFPYSVNSTDKGQQRGLEVLSDVAVVLPEYVVQQGRSYTRMNVCSLNQCVIGAEGMVGAADHRTHVEGEFPSDKTSGYLYLTFLLPHRTFPGL